MANVLIIDDDPSICKMLCDLVQRMGHRTGSAQTLNAGLNEVQSHPYDVVFLDVHMPDGNGLDILPRIREASFPPEVIIMTGFGDPNGAEVAIRNGAWDYLQKPISPRNTLLPLRRVLQYRENLKKASKPPVALKLEGIVGRSPKMAQCLDLLAQAANSEANTLVTGETGTGKELFALAIHENSSRASKSFVVVDCAALPETLVESMLFGHEKGAFTGAEMSREGLIQQAHGGTLFLDEVGELPLSVQKTFLRVLQEHRFRPLGSRTEMHSNFRLVAATNRNLEEMVESGAFRKDLLFRLRAFTMELPPLRDHIEDVRDLTLHYIARFCERYGTETKGFSPDFFQTLVAYHWPGNIRELVNALEQALAAASREPILFPKHLPVNIRVEIARASTHRDPLSLQSSPGPSPPFQPLPLFKEHLEKARKQYLEDLMAITDGNMEEAMKISGISRSTLYDYLKKYDIPTFHPAGA